MVRLPVGCWKRVLPTFYSGGDLRKVLFLLESKSWLTAFRPRTGRLRDAREILPSPTAEKYSSAQTRGVRALQEKTSSKRRETMNLRLPAVAVISAAGFVLPAAIAG